MTDDAPAPLYRTCTPVVDVRFETASPGSLTQKLTEALAAAEDVAVTELDPLYHVIDVEAMAHLVAEEDGHKGAETVISFHLEPWRVFVRSDGRIRVCDGEQESRPKPVFEGDTH